MAFLSQQERKTLAAICDTLAPRLEGNSALQRHSAEDAETVARLEDAYEQIISAAEQRELKLLLRAFELAPVNGLQGMGWRGFSNLPQGEREALLTRWATSPVALQRKAFQGIKRLALFMTYTNPSDDNRQTHDIWRDIEYPGVPGGNPDAEQAIQPTRITSDETLTCDVLIVGSGAGGGVVADELSAAGYDVIVAEKGGYYTEADFDGNEYTAHQRLFEKNGALTTADTAMIVLAGKALGGGTIVNWNTSFATPEHVLREWADDYGIRDAVQPAWQASLDAVLARSHVNTDESQLNANNQKLETGCRALGYHVEPIARNVKGCEECGFCNYGCAFGAKQSTVKTYLRDAHARGTRILVEADVRRILHQHGQTTGAALEVSASNGTRRLVTVKARAVVISAGSLHTPALLMRSGLENPNIGKNLHLHPTTSIISEFPESIHMWRGVPQSRVSKQFSNLDGKGYGVTLEVAPAHPGLTAATLPWIGARDYRGMVGAMGRMANMIAITRDYHSGQIKLDRAGEPILDYRLHPYDAKHLMRGILEALKIHHAAGATKIYSPHNDGQRFVPTGKDADFVRFLRQVEDVGLKPNNYPLFSAHQMSTARMAASPKQGAIKPTGESWEVRNLFVADGSALPTATGVNPMMSIMGISHYIAQHIKQALAG